MLMFTEYGVVQVACSCQFDSGKDKCTCEINIKFDSKSNVSTTHQLKHNTPQKKEKNEQIV
jgi:hypothetical protein